MRIHALALIVASGCGGGVSSGDIVTGQVDAGVSPNKEMRLYVALVEHQDVLEGEEGDEDVAIVYDTSEDALGTLTGTLTGTFTMTGDLEGDVDLDLSMSGDMEEVAGSDGDIRRVPGSTQITGTARSSYGSYAVDLTI